MARGMRLVVAKREQRLASLALDPAPWQLTSEASCAPFAQRAPRLAQGGNRKARKAQTVRALSVSFHLLLTDALGSYISSAFARLSR